MGLAFQLVDDVLGIWGDTAVTGKPVFSDLRSRKKTLPVTYGLADARRGPELAAWLAAGGAGTGRGPGVENDERELRRIADLVAAAGGREWALEEARHRMALAEKALSTVDLETGARADLLALGQFIVDRRS